MSISSRCQFTTTGVVRRYYKIIESLGLKIACCSDVNDKFDEYGVYAKDVNDVINCMESERNIRVISHFDYTKYISKLTLIYRFAKTMKDNWTSVGAAHNVEAERSINDDLSECKSVKKDILEKDYYCWYKYILENFGWMIIEYYSNLEAYNNIQAAQLRSTKYGHYKHNLEKFICYVCNADNVSEFDKKVYIKNVKFLLHILSLLPFLHFEKKTRFHTFSLDTKQIQQKGGKKSKRSKASKPSKTTKRSKTSKRSKRSKTLAK